MKYDRIKQAKKKVLPAQLKSQSLPRSSMEFIWLSLFPHIAQKHCLPGSDYDSQVLEKEIEL